MLQPHRLYSVRATVIAIVLLPLLAVFGGGGLLILGAVEDRIEARMQEDISLIARTLRTPLARSLERRREVSLDRALRSTSELGRVYGVYLYDSDGNLLAQADQAAGNRRPEGAVPEIESLDRGEYRSVGGREVYSYFTPLIGNGGQAIGMLQVTRRASDIRDYLAALRANVALVMLGLSGAFVGIVLLGYTS